MISIQRVALGNDKHSVLNPNIEFIDSKQCRPLVDVRYFAKQNLCNDGNGTIILGIQKPSKKLRDFDFEKTDIIRANTVHDQIILQTKVDGSDDMLLIFWNADDNTFPEDTVSPDKVRGGCLIHGNLIEWFVDGSRSSESYVYKARRIHHINDDEALHFFAILPSEEADVATA